MSNFETEHMPESSAQVIRDVLRELDHHDTIATPDAPALAKTHLITLPDGRNLHNLTDAIHAAAQRHKPYARKGTAEMKDLDSLIAWANRFKGDTSVMYADPSMQSPSLTCIADYHAEGAPNIDPDKGDDTARHCQHRAKYVFPLSKEWQAWMQIDGVMMSKDDMGEFIESHAHEILQPTPAIINRKPDAKNQPWENDLIETALRIDGKFGTLSQLLAMSRHFQVSETSEISAKTNRDTGETEIQFSTKHQGTPERG
ncbi:DUF2303 family protein [Pseudooceanicola sp. MF1-13]|uniref:DUF2303 family protein n=1 Tax=Pseudooceanicola sp. MF1-13 TaxID=3379095 RepID=UPI0038924F34